ncbi:hypothetical protein GCM10010413_47130 [Promicromonospora sukumoe]|uniref:Uncharacterized protein n=1 Tax=Promicromonospora sukumoe TaxID=88382 RepID=A0A7W3JCE1_9MICO|nr:hypothetical protein [Promicromonospora sukumoe]MBA8810276.1 hypothetical protein [Promicromonospora sukumoe]
MHDAFEIIGALGGAAAAVIAVVLASRERTDRKIAEAERDTAQEKQRTAEQAEVRRERERQARQVAVWVDDDEPLAWESCAEEGPEVPESFLNIANYSSHPVFDVGPGDYLDPSHQGPSSIGVMQRILRPGETRRFNLGRIYFGSDDGVNPLWFFRDLAGNSWTMDHAGILDLLEPSTRD